jgi:release factor glutamine methyltransferase
MGESWTVRRLLEWTAGFFERKGVDAPRLSAELLLGHVMGLARIQLYTNYEREVGEGELGRFRELVKRAGEQEPIAYLTGKAHFFNLELEVERGVLIPRPDTETLVENVLQMIRHTVGMEGPRVLDLCTGSGCIALAIAERVKAANVVAVDKSTKAVEVATRNAAKLGLGDRVRVLEGDLYEPLGKLVDVQPFDLIVSNPPYIPTDEIAKLDRNVRDYEPHEALDGGADGLALHRRILAEAAERLASGGRIYLEIQFDQGEAARELMAGAAGLEEVRVLKDYGGRDRVVTGRRG